MLAAAHSKVRLRLACHVLQCQSALKLSWAIVGSCTPKHDVVKQRVSVHRVMLYTAKVCCMTLLVVTGFLDEQHGSWRTAASHTWFDCNTGRP